MNKRAAEAHASDLPTSKKSAHDDEVSPTTSLDKLYALIEEHQGCLVGLADDADQVMVSALNEMITPEIEDKGDNLLALLDTEGIYIWGCGGLPPPMLTLVQVPAFKGVARVWEKMLIMGGDPNEEYAGTTPLQTAEIVKSPVIWL